MSGFLPSSELIVTNDDINLCLGSGELKRCPFCGSSAISTGRKTPNGLAIMWKIQCTGMKGLIPDCYGSVTATDPDQAIARTTAVERWNKRAP